MSYNFANAVSTYRSLANMCRVDHDDFYVALTAFALAREMGHEQPGTSLLDDRDSDELMLRLGGRIMDVCHSTSDPRFTFLDMADAIVNYPAEYSLVKLAELNDDDFETVILYMTQCKRDTYEGDNIQDDVAAAEAILATIALEKAPPIEE